MARKYRITITLDDQTYSQIRNLAHKENKSMSEVIRSAAMESLIVKINSENIDLITSIIREQLRDVMQPQVERLATLSAKTCVQAATAAYLNAEALGRLVAPNLQEDVKEIYEKARKKGVEYTKRKNETRDLKEE